MRPIILHPFLMRTATTLAVLMLTMMAFPTGAKAQTVRQVNSWSALKDAVATGGDIKLTADITRDVAEYINVTETVTLDLNGHTIDGNEKTKYIFVVDTDGDLTITDETTNKDGQIFGAQQTANIYIINTGKVTLEAGTIGGPTSCVKLYDSGSFTMTGGTIAGNVYGVNLVDNSSFTMSGGTISGLKNGVSLGSNNRDKSISFTMSGGTITGNVTGVDIGSDNVTFTVSGNITISGNTSKDVILKWDGVTSSGFKPIHIDGSLSPSARIGVWTDKNAVEGIDKVFTSGLGGNGSAANFFVSGRSDLAIVANGNELCFAKGTALTVNDAGGSQNYWCSYYNKEKNMRVNSKDVTVYKAKLNGTTSVTLTKVFSNTDDYGVIGKNNAVLIHSTNSDVLNLIETTDGADGDYTGNDLLGVDEDTNQDANWYYYVISKPDASSDFGFYKLQDGVQLGAHKAYLQVDPSIFNSISSRGFLSIGDDGATAIDNEKLTIDNGAGAWYDLQGRRIEKPARKGIYVRDSKKYIIK